MALTVAEVAHQLQGVLTGDGSLVLTGFAPADKAKPGDLTFAENQAYFHRAEQSAASAILVDGPYASDKKTIVRVQNARLAFAKAIPIFFPEPEFTPGIHPSAVVAASARVAPSAHVGPLCVIGENVQIMAGVVLEGSNQIGANSVIGEGSHLFPRVVLYPRTQVGQRVRLHGGVVIGADGFGYVFDAGFHRKVPQVGNVVIQDDVEIGANSTVDRGALGPTVIGKGSKIDNLVQVAHNVVMGEHCLVVAQAGIAGSTKIGNYVTIAGQVGLAGHLKIGNNVVVAAQSGVMNSIPDGEQWFGTPAQPARQTKRQILAIQHLPELTRRVRELEQRLGALPNPTPPEGATP